MRTWAYSLFLLPLVASCAVFDDGAGDGEGGKFDSPASSTSGLGAAYAKDGTTARFRVAAPRATRVEVHVYGRASGEDELARFEMRRDGAGIWSVEIPTAGLPDVLYYGYRAWGPNWAFDAAWEPGSELGFRADVDGDGNRFNPNKLLLDPYAVEMSHDPITPEHRDGTVYASGPLHRAKDSGPVAPKGVLLRSDHEPVGERPTRPLKDEVIYEVHVRGLTMNDPSVAPELRGTYAGAAQKAAYLKSLGITAVEFLPLHETENDQNDNELSTVGDNYWGYMTLSFFAPDRRYAHDRSAGGPTREFKQMIRAFHEQGIKVYVDVVYNHTGEGGLWDGTGDTANVLSFRGLDNPGYYELTGGNRFSWDNTGVGGNFNAASPVARDLILDSLKYWRNNLGVDGFRFDLASVLGNACQKECWQFDKLDPDNALNRAVRELPVRPEGGGIGADLIAEPWAVGDGTYQVGNFPAGWAEWNGKFRDTFRKDQNKLGQEAVTPGELAARIAGSSDLYADDGRRPWHSVNFIVAHDGFTLRDLYAYNGKSNLQPWPFGPSDGGEDNNVSWNQGGDPALQRQAARTGLAMLMLSAGVPMITGGDEMYRTQYGNNNAYNLDSPKNWLDWSDLQTHARFADFARRITRFRGDHPALRLAQFFTGTDRNGNGVKDIAWYRDTGAEADGAYMDNASMHFLAYRIDGTEAAGEPAASIYVAYNGWSGPVTATLPRPAQGRAWYRVADTAPWMEGQGNAAEPGQEAAMNGTTYELAPRSVLVLVER